MPFVERHFLLYSHWVIGVWNLNFEYFSYCHINDHP